MSLPLLFYNLVVVFVFGIKKFKIKLANVLCGYAATTSADEYMYLVIS